MAIILPHTTSDIQFFRSNGVCYRRTDWGVEGTPDTSWDEMVDTQYNDFGTYGSCEACQEAVSVPATTPCTSATFLQLRNGTIPTCGYADDPVYRQYTVSFTNVSFCPGYGFNLVPEDQPTLTNILSAGLPYDGTTFQWAEYYEGALNPDTPCRIPGTLYTPWYVITSPGTCATWLRLDSAYGWIFYSYCNSVYGIWRKKTGVTPAGVYTILACGETCASSIIGTVVNRALTPSSILVEAIIP